jgi:hypothetical protein
MNGTRGTRPPHQDEEGSTLVELAIAVLVLTVGLLGLAHLFVVATMTSALSVNTSEALIDAQRCLEAYRSIAVASPVGVADLRLVSGTCDSSIGNSPAYADATGHDSTGFEESVWVFNRSGALVTGAHAVNPAAPEGINPAELRAPSQGSRLVIVRLEPILANARYNQTVTLSTVIGPH